jgi:hypothetical protein
VRAHPQAAFRVETFEQHREGPEILIPPLAVADFVRAALLRKCGMAFESVQDPNVSRFGP